MQQKKIRTIMTSQELIALEDMSEIFEVSTEHFDEDSYRIRTGDKL